MKRDVSMIITGGRNDTQNNERRTEEEKTGENKAKRKMLMVAKVEKKRCGI